MRKIKHLEKNEDMADPEYIVVKHVKGMNSITISATNTIVRYAFDLEDAKKYLETMAKESNPGPHHSFCGTTYVKYRIFKLGAELVTNFERKEKEIKKTEHYCDVEFELHADGVKEKK